MGQHIFFHVWLVAAVSGFWLLVCIVVVMIFTLNATKTLNMTKTLDDRHADFMAGATCGAGNAHFSGTPGFAPPFARGS